MPTTTPTAIPIELPPDFGAADADALALVLGFAELDAAAAAAGSACCTSLSVKPV